MFRRFLRRDERLDEGVRKTRSSFFGRLAALLPRSEITDDLWGELEETLIAADVGVDTTERLLERLRARHAAGEFGTGKELSRGLQEELAGLLRPPDGREPLLPSDLTVVLTVGVNGVGKTTTVAKLGHHWSRSGRRVLLAAGDTFRAAGTEQLAIWADRVGLPCVAAQRGGDPGAIVFDAIAAARARGFDVVVVDTAGRLHTKTNLMEELRKIRRIVDRQGVVGRVILVLDAATGQNAVVQARSFASAIGTDAIVVTKLDGTARGGMVFSVVRELGAPVCFVGTGEKVGDLAEFDSEAFVAALFALEAPDDLPGN
ncbi:MAG: signal recognition particle-docking protein FtsY [Chloroflexi bacterium]|nr:signal recognition particle-docking protein FtsY [Chloroflexota bacterium]